MPAKSKIEVYVVIALRLKLLTFASECTTLDKASTQSRPKIL